MMASQKQKKDSKSLNATVASANSLIRTFQAGLSAPSSGPQCTSNDLNPLRFLHDASKLLKAQTTKLSLLIINKPFTPSAISTIVNSISSECLPALLSAFELCRPERYTDFLRDHLKQTLTRLLHELAALVSSIPNIGEKGLSAPKDDGQGTLANTGVIWEICDSLASVVGDGLVRLATQKAETYHSLLQDAIAELEVWDPDEEEEDGFIETGDSSSSENASGSEDGSGASQPLETAMNGMALTPPPTPSPIRRLLTDTLTNLRLIRLLYPALKKRRISTFPGLSATSAFPDLPDASQITRFDVLMRHLKGFSEHADELAGALYSHDEDDVADRLRLMRAACKECSEEMRLNWTAKEDEFSAWSQKWNERLD